MARMGMDLGMRGEQQMLLQPRMLQSIQVLEMPSLSLEGWLMEAAERNEALRLEAPGGTQPVAERRGTRADSDAHDEMLRNQPDRQPSLSTAALDQLALSDVEPELVPWVRFLVGCLDERGYLALSDDELLELARERGLESAPGENAAGRLGAGIAALQGLEPRGIGARGAIEALLLQLDPEDADYSLLCRLLEDFLEELAKNKLPAVARALDLEIDELLRLIDTLRELDPRPAASLVNISAPVITPDVLVEAALERDSSAGPGEEYRSWEVTVMRSALPAVSIDPDVADLARNKEHDRDVRAYARKKVDEARWIVEAVEQRGKTLLRVARAVFHHQREFLERGPGHLAPLRMGSVAEELDLHVSTISRAVAEKYAQTPWGIFPLRSFFQAATGGEEGPARDDARDLVREVVAGEDRSHPLSDDEIVRALESKGLKVARRTVAKYRKELGLPSSYRRRTYDG